MSAVTYPAIPEEPDPSSTLLLARARDPSYISANIGFSRSGAIFGNDNVTAAIIDPLIHHGQLLAPIAALLEKRTAAQRPGNTGAADCIDLTKHKRALHSRGCRWCLNPPAWRGSRVM